jgi:choline dehydrogenase-like flavoprotein
MATIADIEALTRLEAEVCVVGSGPVGLAVAVTLVRRGIAVVLLESGRERPDSAKQELSDVEITDRSRHAEMRVAVSRAWGGTGRMWGGRCTPLAPIDFEPRPHVDSAGWPISADDLDGYSADAAAFIGCVEGHFNAPAAAVDPGPDLDLTRLERWCERPNVGAELRKRGLPATFALVLDATVVDLELDDARRRVAAVRIVSGNREVRFAGAKRFVLACGGLETVRLLLHVQARHPDLLGKAEGPLGRYYMGHVSGKVARIRFRSPQMANLFAYGVSDSGGVYRRRICFTASLLRRERLPDVIFYPDNPMLGDPTHRSGLLSALFLALSTPVIGKRLISEAILRSQMTDRPRYLEHLRNVIVDAPSTVGHLADVLHQKFVLHRTKPFVFLQSKSGEYPLHYHAEHLPSADSRVRLTEARDATGSRRLRVDLRFSRADAEGVARAHDRLAAALSKGGLADLVFGVSRGKVEDAIVECAGDGIHQIGLARMASDPRDGVVDRDCKVFGIDNLFLAGSAVFRTSGHANPTFTAVALGLRLADHLTAMAAATGKVPTGVAR